MLYTGSNVNLTEVSSVNAQSVQWVVHPGSNFFLSLNPYYLEMDLLTHFSKCILITN